MARIKFTDNSGTKNYIVRNNNCNKNLKCFVPIFINGIPICGTWKFRQCPKILKYFKKDIKKIAIS